MDVWGAYWYCSLFKSWSCIQMNIKSFNYFWSTFGALKVWGSENFAWSFKVWMCGGQIEIALCSRDGHFLTFKRIFKNEWLLNKNSYVSLFCSIFLIPNHQLIRYYFFNSSNLVKDFLLNKKKESVFPRLCKKWWKKFVDPEFKTRCLIWWAR